MLNIDSQVFAEEVEPTGCVPMALSLERYRFAALPSKVKEADPRLTPRNTPRLFQSSVIINNERVVLGRKLNEWFDSPKQSWRCVFRASLHGFSADAFHNYVDGLAPTYTVARLRDPDVSKSILLLCYNQFVCVEPIGSTDEFQYECVLRVNGFAVAFPIFHGFDPNHLDMLLLAKRFYFLMMPVAGAKDLNLYDFL